MEENYKEEIICIDKSSAVYPRRLKECGDMPEKIYVKGRLPDDDKPSIAIVGARMCSSYGRMQSFRYGKVLSQAGVQVISGMAYGIDAEAHLGALEGEEPTYAVLGCGADICYPARNKRLYSRILRKGGGMVSEYPPGTPVKSYHFPARNRIISALADVVLVMEAREKSGSLITAQYAIEQGKSVYALPGAVQEELSLGCHKLIYDGAGIAYAPEVLLDEWGIISERVKKKEKRNLVLASDLNLVYSCLDLRPKNLDYFISETGFSPEKISNLLMELELLGLARETGRHYYVKGEETCD
ncbi:MAG TPA: DNA-processing protein DprA [Candidatus Blautia faecavium]|uniref:DNA-processing protein DprA n=1 Tax=Candidatus Blautia faecavium TaxID=2838487 RepID=A0A9D2LVD2_9FIRM|nr:DNA-processing protein DprA [Candidatus Blautia faecavium]